MRHLPNDCIIFIEIVVGSLLSIISFTFLLNEVDEKEFSDALPYGVV